MIYINLQLDNMVEQSPLKQPLQNVDVPESEVEAKKGTLDDFDPDGLFDGDDDLDELDAILGDVPLDAPKEPKPAGGQIMEEEKKEGMVGHQVALPSS